MGGTAAAPGDEDLLVELANAGHEGPDELADPAALAAWWARLRGPASATGSSEASLAALRDLRRTVQAAAAHHNGGEGLADVAAADGAPTALTDLALRPHLSGDRVVLAPQHPGDLAADIAATALTALLRAAARPTWTRVKACRGADCGWVFVDASRNSSRRWCEMATCGNRAKTTRFRSRHRAR